MGLSGLRACTALADGSTSPVLRRLEQFATLTDAERELVVALTTRRQLHSPGEELCTHGEAAALPRLIVSGWGCRMRVLADGRRQIFNFLIPGDFICLSSRADSTATLTTAALTALTTTAAGALTAVLQAGLQTPSGLAAALLDAERAEENMLFDHLVRLGQLTAYERTAHLLLELQERMSAAGLGDHRFPLPLTQELLADALGLSLVHVNRTLKQLRRDRLLILTSGMAELPDLHRLRQVASRSSSAEVAEQARATC